MQLYIKNTFLSNADNASMALRKLLLEGKLHYFRLPGGTLQEQELKQLFYFSKKENLPKTFGTTN